MGLLDFLMAKSRQKDMQVGSAVSGSTLYSTVGSRYTSPEIDAALITDYIDNPYYFKVKQNQRNLIFADVVTVEVVDASTDEPDEKLTALMKEITTQPEVALDAKMQMGWASCFDYGCALFNNVWKWRGAEYRPVAMRFLPPESFAESPLAVDYIAQGDILRGIVMDRDGEMQYWQKPSALETPVQLPTKNITMVKDPYCPAIAGKPGGLPIIQLVTLLKYCWKAQMQKVGRVGAPTLAGKITEPKARKANEVPDATYLLNILKGWGNNSVFALRENMEFVDTFLKDDQTALETINALTSLIDRMYSPSSLITKEGTLIGGSNAGELELMIQAIEAEHRWLEEQYERMFQQYLEINQYEGYRVRLTIPSPSFDRSDIEIRQAQAAYQTKSATLNEIRAWLHLEPVTDEIMEELEEYYKPVALPGFEEEAGSRDDQQPRVKDEEDLNEDEEEEEALKKAKKGYAQKQIVIPASVVQKSPDEIEQQAEGKMQTALDKAFNKLMQTLQDAPEPETEEEKRPAE